MSFHLLSIVAALLLIAFVFSALDGKRKFFHLIFISHSYPRRETSKKKSRHSRLPRKQYVNTEFAVANHAYWTNDFVFTKNDIISTLPVLCT